MAFNPPSLLPNGLSGDPRQLDQLKAAANRTPTASIKETSRQFEALFMQEVMKSMRASTMSSGMMDNAGTQMGTEMLDQQFAAKLTGLPGGLSDAIARQLQRQMGVAASAQTAPAAVNNARAAAASASLPTLANKNVPSHVQSFILQHDAAAKAAQQVTGVPASFMIAQAAHESGWGKHEILNKDGSSSYNVFGIKATAGWTGKTTDVTTTEYVNGQPQRVTAKFRAYGSYAEAYQDYARLLTSNDRYKDVVAQASSSSGGSTVSPAISAQSFARGLQKAGYATDPDYADKLAKVINTTVRVQRAMA